METNVDRSPRGQQSVPRVNQVQLQEEVWWCKVQVHYNNSLNAVNCALALASKGSNNNCFYEFFM